MSPILVGDEEEIFKSAEESCFNIRGAEIVDPKKYDRLEEMIDLFCELRKSKGITREQARGILSQANYFGTMLVKMGVADALLGGATYSTADTVRPALQLIKTKPGNTIVSSCFIMVRPAATGENEVLAMGDHTKWRAREISLKVPGAKRNHQILGRGSGNKESATVRSHCAAFIITRRCKKTSFLL